jgi:hypothetical protein
MWNGPPGWSSERAACGVTLTNRVATERGARKPGALVYEALARGDRHAAREVIGARRARLFKPYRKHRGQRGLLDAISLRLPAGTDVVDTKIVEAMLDVIELRIRNGEPPESLAITLARVIREIVETKLDAVLPPADVRALQHVAEFIRGKAGDMRHRLLGARDRRIFRGRAHPDGEETHRDDLAEDGETARSVELAGERVFFRIFGQFPPGAGYSVTHVVVGLAHAYRAAGSPKKES